MRIHLPVRGVEATIHFHTFNNEGERKDNYVAQENIHDRMQSRARTWFGGRQQPVGRGGACTQLQKKKIAVHLFSIA